MLYSTGLRGHGSTYIFHPVNTVSLLRQCTALLLGCGFLSFFLVGYELKARLKQENGFVMQHKQSARQYSYAMAFLYGIGLAFTLVPVPWLFFDNGNGILPKDAEDGGHPAAGYGIGEDSEPFQAIAGLYIAYKLMPLAFLLCERAIDKQHRHRLRKGDRVFAGSKEEESAEPCCCSVYDMRWSHVHSPLSPPPQMPGRLSLNSGVLSDGPAGGIDMGAPSTTAYVALHD